MSKERGSLNRRIEDIKDNHIEILDLKNTISKMKALGDELKSIIEGREERNSEFKDRTIEMIQSEQQKKQTKRKKKNQSLRELRWEPNKRSNVCVIGVPGEEKDDKDERLSKK